MARRRRCGIVWLRRGPDRAARGLEPHHNLRLGTIAPQKVVGGSPPRSLPLLIKGLSRERPGRLGKEGEPAGQCRRGISGSFQSPRHGH